MAEIRVPKMGKKRVKFVPDHKSFGAFIKSDQMRDVTHEVVQDMANVAKLLTPVGDGDNGHMKDKWDAVRGTGFLKVSGNVRVMSTLVNTDPEAALVEFGSRHNKRRRIAARAGAVFGDFKSGKSGPLQSDGTF